MSESSELDAEQKPTTSSSVNRLGKCEVCNGRDANYTCPKCEVKSCCLDCVNIHKQELECDGVRDRTKFIRLKDFTNSDLLSDYRLLEECARFVYSKKRDEKKAFTRIDKELPYHLFRLRKAARNRGTALQFLTQHFTRHTTNTTFYDWKTDIINWRVEWLFPNATPQAVKFVDERCPEGDRLSELLDKYLSPNVDIEGSNALGFYHSAGFAGLRILLKAEKVRSSSKKYFELDLEESLASNLAGKCIVEYPIICVVLRDHSFNFDIVTSDDEFDCGQNVENKNKVAPEQDVSATTESLNNESQENNISEEHSDPRRRNGFSNGYGRRRRGGFHRQNNFNGGRHKRNRELLTERVAKERKLEIQKEIKADKKKKPKNLLFTTGYSSDESLTDSEDGTKLSGK